MSRVQTQFRFAGRFVIAIGIAAAASCILAGAWFGFLAILSGLPRNPFVVLAMPMALIITAPFALLLGFYGAYMFLAPAMVVAWRLRADAVGLAIAGAVAGLAHTICVGVLAQAGAVDFESPLKGVVQFGGFALAVAAAHDRNPAFYMGMLIYIPLAGAASGWLAARFLGVAEPPWSA